MEKKYIICIDVGGTNLKAAVLDLKYAIRGRKVVGTKKFQDKEALIAAIVSLSEEIIEIYGINKKEVLGVGIGLPGPIDAKNAIVHFLPNIPGWKEVKLAARLNRMLRLPVFLDNDVNLMSIGELAKGAAKGFRNVLCLTLGTGVGGGVIIEGKLYRGEDNVSGEIGHLPLNEKGPRCNCGGIACLEAYIGNNRLISQARKVFGRAISLEELSLEAKRKNPKAQKIWLQAAERLGLALTSAINLLNLDAVVIGGGIANAGRILFDKVKETIDERAMKIHAHHVKILKAELGNDAALIGAAILVKEGLR